MSEQKKQSIDSSKAIIGDVKKSVKAQEKKQDLHINIGKDGTTIVDVNNVPKKLKAQKFWIAWSYKKRIIFIIGMLAIVITFVLILSVSLNNNNSSSTLISTMTPEQVNSLSTKQATEITLLNINPRKDPKAGYIQALAFSQIGNNTQALKVIKTVASTRYGGFEGYDVYVNYALIASRTGDNKLAIEKMKKAIILLNSNSKIDSEVKKEETEKLNSKINGFEDVEQ